MNKKLNDLIAAPLTGYHPDGSVNKDVISQYAKMLHSNGVTGAFVNGTTGEGLSLTVSERMALSKRWVESAPDGFQVIVHVGHTSQTVSRRLAEHAADIGANAIAEIGPVFYKPDTVEALVDYTAYTAAAVPDMPYYYYHMPSRNNIVFPMIEFLRHAESAIPNLKGIKYTHDDLSDYEECLKFLPGKYNILFGRDEFLIEGLKAEAVGAVGSTFNILAPLYNELVKLFREGNIEKAQQLQNMSANTITLLSETGGYGSALKAVMRMIGIDLGIMRRPQMNLSDQSEKDLELSLHKSGAFNFLNTL
jgi:N-acetylneuraminate lyase